MIINEELKASWDEPTNSLVLHQTEPTRLQVCHTGQIKFMHMFN